MHDFVDDPEVVIVKVPTALYFGNTPLFKAHCHGEVLRSMRDEERGDPTFWKGLILDLSAVRSTDSSGMQALVDVVRVRPSVRPRVVRRVNPALL